MSNDTRDRTPGDERAELRSLEEERIRLGAPVAGGSLREVPLSTLMSMMSSSEFGPALALTQEIRHALAVMRAAVLGNLEFTVETPMDREDVDMMFWGLLNKMHVLEELVMRGSQRHAAPAAPASDRPSDAGGSPSVKPGAAAPQPRLARAGSRTSTERRRAAR